MPPTAFLPLTWRGIWRGRVGEGPLKVGEEGIELDLGGSGDRLEKPNILKTARDIDHENLSVQLRVVEKIVSLTISSVSFYARYLFRNNSIDHVASSIIRNSLDTIFTLPRSYYFMQDIFISQQL